MWNLDKSLKFIILPLNYMALRKEKTSGTNYFKPDYYVNYKSTEWVFKLFNRETKESSEVKELKFYSLINVKKYKIWEWYTSSIFENLFNDIITLRDADNFSFIWRYKFDLDKRDLVSLDDWLQADLWKWTTCTVIYWLLETWESFVLDLWWNTVDRNLTRKDKEKTNLDKVKVFNDSVYIELKAQPNKLKVWQGKKTKEIFLLDIEWDTRDVPVDFADKAEEVISMIEDELKNNQSWWNNKTTTTTTIPEDEISIEDIPF